jgi:anhydro-N-acetylmuramic acid kinase
MPAGATPEQLIAFDTGPGNCVSDHLCRTMDPGGRGFDAGGVRAAGGMPSGTMKAAVLAAPYFDKPPPKSTDGPEMIQLFNSAPPSVRPITLDDLLATACLITGASIQHAILKLAPLPDEIIVSGGGTKNACIMKYLTFEMPIPVLRTDEVGVASEAKEAIAFALLGAATLDGVPSNVPSATGARRPVVLGSITPKP